MAWTALEAEIHAEFDLLSNYGHTELAAWISRQSERKRRLRREYVRAYKAQQRLIIKSIRAAHAKFRVRIPPVGRPPHLQARYDKEKV